MHFHRMKSSHRPVPHAHTLSKIADLEFVALDFESAGTLPGHTDVPIQVGMVLFRQGRIEQPGGFVSYLRVNQPIAWQAQKQHGITLENLKQAPTLLELWPTVKHYLAGRWIVAHGIGTEKRFLRQFPAHGFGPWVDTLTLARRLLPPQPSYALGDVAQALGMTRFCTDLIPNFRWHDALCDAIGCAAALKRMIEVANLYEAPGSVLL